MSAPLRRTRARRSRWWSVVAALLLAGAGVFVVRLRALSAAEAEQRAGAARRVTLEAEVRDRNLALYRRAATIDTLSATFPARLASLYLQRARATGDYDDYRRAEDAARHSLALRRSRNGDAAVALASALMAQHRFLAADTVAAELLARDADVPGYRALLGEIRLELGDYASADTLFATLAPRRTAASVAARYARWLELRGHTDHARTVIAAAARDALGRDDLSREQIAWFFLRMGDLQWRDGRVRLARRAYDEGLTIAPDDYRLLGASARLAAAEGRWRDAITAGEGALATTLDPATLATLEDAWRAVGDSAHAAEYAKTIDVAFLSQAGPMHRALGLHLLDRRRHVPLVLARAREELATRHDVYGYDLLAWALHAGGDDAAADTVMQRALAAGTADALLEYHAGAIAAALGRRADARRHLARALALDPYFDPFHPADARALLRSLDGPS